MWQCRFSSRSESCCWPWWFWAEVLYPYLKKYLHDEIYVYDFLLCFTEGNEKSTKLPNFFPSCKKYFQSTVCSTTREVVNCPRLRPVCWKALRQECARLKFRKGSAHYPQLSHIPCIRWYMLWYKVHTVVAIFHDGVLWRLSCSLRYNFSNAESSRSDQDELFDLLVRCPALQNFLKSCWRISTATRGSNPGQLLGRLLLRSSHMQREVWGIRIWERRSSGKELAGIEKSCLGEYQCSHQKYF